MNRLHRGILGVTLVGAVSALGVAADHRGWLDFSAVSSARAAEQLQLKIATAPGLRPVSVVLGANGVIDLRDRAVVAAPISNIGTVRTDLGVDARAANIASAGRVTLRDRARVDGTVVTSVSPTLGNGASITGATTLGASFADQDGKTISISWPGGYGGAEEPRAGSVWHTHGWRRLRQREREVALHAQPVER